MQAKIAQGLKEKSGAHIKSIRDTEEQIAVSDHSCSLITEFAIAQVLSLRPVPEKSKRASKSQVNINFAGYAKLNEVSYLIFPGMHKFIFV